MRRNYKNLKRRYAKSFYYGRLTNKLDRLSLPLTDFVVEYFDAYAPYDYLDPDFANRLSLEGSVGPTTLIVAMIYLERMRLMDKNQFETSDPADLFSSALLCASKYLYDNDDEDYVYNDEWSASCSKSLQYINEKEIDFLIGVGWNLLAKEDEFQRSLEALEKHVALKQISKRNFSIYSDLCCLLNWNDFKEFFAAEFLRPFLSIFALATMTYIASLFGMYAVSLQASLKFQQSSTNCKQPSDLKLGVVCPPVEPPTGFYYRKSAPESEYEYESEILDNVIVGRCLYPTTQTSTADDTIKSSSNPNVVGIYGKSPFLMEDAKPHLDAYNSLEKDICSRALSSKNFATLRNMTRRMLGGVVNLDISTKFLV